VYENKKPLTESYFQIENKKIENFNAGVGKMMVLKSASTPRLKSGWF
jgi:hypothetical protein